MTPHQIERTRQKILNIKKDLAYDKKRWGGYYHDGAGLRYMPPQLYIKLRDYKGAYNYFKWFKKNFPDDICSPIFLFEWTLVLFKVSRIKEAENKALHTVWSDPHIFEHFLHLEELNSETFNEGQWKVFSKNTKNNYSKFNQELEDFSLWLNECVNTKRYQQFKEELLNINSKLEAEQSDANRSSLVNRLFKMIEDL